MATYNFTTYPNPVRKNRIKILTGQRFGRLLVIGFAGVSANSHAQWHCLCDCGNGLTVEARILKGVRQLSCGCWKVECSHLNIRHGEAGNGKESTEYRSYQSAKKRCNTPSAAHYADYGGRGIEFRFESYEQFLEHIGRKPTPQHTIERLDVNGHYEIGNVKWATPAEQGLNKRNNRHLTALGKTLCESEWARQSGIAKGTIAARRRAKWCITCAVTIPVGKGRCLHKPKP